MVDWCLLFTYDCDCFEASLPLTYALVGGSTRAFLTGGINLLGLDIAPSKWALWDTGACRSYDCDRLGKSTSISVSLTGGTVAHGDQNGTFLIFLAPTKFHSAWDTGACL